MLQKGAIAGKMMGSQWFAYSKFRGDWQNLSVCENVDDPIQFVILYQNWEYIRNLQRALVRHHSNAFLFSLLSSSGHSGAKPHRKKNQVSDPEHGETSQLVSSPPPGSCWQRHYHYAIMWHVVTSGQWSVTPSGHTTHCPRWPGSHGVTCARPHNGPSLLTGLNWPQSSATCHREHEAKQNPLKSRTKNTNQDEDGTEMCHIRDGNELGYCHECDAFTPNLGFYCWYPTGALLCQLQTIGWERERVGMMLHILHNITKYPD